MIKIRFRPRSCELLSEYVLVLLGELDPSREISGIQARLANLGYYHDEVTGKLDDNTREAIGRFKRSHLGDCDTGVDSALVASLVKAHVT